MNNRILTASFHLMAWLLLLLVPYLSTFQVVHSFAPDFGKFSYSPLLVLSIFTVSIFYLNYYVLIPRFLLNGQAILYVAVLTFTVLSAFLLSGLYLYLQGMHPDVLAEMSPNLAKIRPIIRANAFFMLTIAIMASISLAFSNRLKQIESEKLSAQIASLKAQINPHFLFNTLNSIYATVIDSAPATAEMVDKLSAMMRYTLKETEQDLVSLEEEMEYIENYIELQKIRLDKQVKIEFRRKGNFKGLEITPMLLISFVENAFKHGVNAEENSSITIDIETDTHEVYLLVTNNKVTVQTDTNESNGLGIKNTRKRLELIYPSRHLLQIRETEKDFTVSLRIQLK